MAVRAVLSPNGRFAFSLIPRSKYDLVFREMNFHLMKLLSIECLGLPGTIASRSTDTALRLMEIPKFGAIWMSFMEKNFFPNETINKALNLFTEGTINASLRHFLRLEMEQEMSYMIVDRTSDTLIGAQINSELSPAMKAERFRLIQQLMTTHRKWHAYVAVYQSLFPDDMFKVCGTDSIFEQHMCTILPAYQGQGLFKISVRMAHELALARGYSAELAIATAAATKPVLDRLGFHVHRQVNLRDIIFDGQPIIYSPDPDVKLYVMINQLKKRTISDDYFLV